MSNQRSPNCPQITFLEAIEKGRKVYENEHTHPAAKEVVAGDLGYKGLNGASLTIIGALRQYGILEGSKDAMRVSEDAVIYFEMDDSWKKREAALRMAFKPVLLAEMKAQYGKSIPSEGNLKHWLITKGFLPKAAADIILVYKENIKLDSGEEEDYSGGEKDETMTQIPITNQSQQKTQSQVGLQTYSFALSPETRAELSLKGPVTADDLAMLRDHIDLTIKALTRAKGEA
ncbi:MAG TPA: hypothetical protein VMW38_06095 [Terriglobia bacterium]|nr:hypothetical protein [Terriglobia bacterium]